MHRAAHLSSSSESSLLSDSEGAASLAVQRLALLLRERRQARDARRGERSRVHEKKLATVAALGVARDEPRYLHLARTVFHLRKKISASARAGREGGGSGAWVHGSRAKGGSGRRGGVSGGGLKPGQRGLCGKAWRPRWCALRRCPKSQMLLLLPAALALY